MATFESSAPQTGRSGNMHTGYLGWVALRKEQCDMMEWFNKRSHPLCSNGWINTGPWQQICSQR
jgi:hypothetical protein